MNPSIVPSRPSSGASWAIVASKSSFSSSRGTSTKPASSSASRTRSRPWSRFKMAVLTNRATGPGVASQMDRASTTLLRLRTVRTPLRNSVELICARWQCKNRSMKTATPTALTSRSNHSTGPPLANISGTAGMPPFIRPRNRGSKAKVWSRLESFRLASGARQPNPLCMERPDQLRELFRMQAALNRRIGVRTEGMSAEDKTKWLLNYCRAMSQEIAGLTDSVPWKWWAKYQKFDEQNARVEVVDLFHFLISLAQVLGMSADDVFNAYIRKNEVNFKRQETGYTVKDDHDSKHI